MKTTQCQKIVEFLKEHPNQEFTAKEIARSITSRYADEYEEKRSNPRFLTHDDFVSQVSAEIGANKQSLLRLSGKVHLRDKPKPRKYSYRTDDLMAIESAELIEEKEPINSTTLDASLDLDDNEEDSDVTIVTQQSFCEHDMYPILIDYLHSENGLYCLRIDEKKSKNNRGSGGNQWLHPDVVAMEALDREWNHLVKTCVKQSSGNSVKLWSFEVKKELTLSNVRRSFFQAVSNSSWANEGYLVAASINDSRTEKELRMLSALHGIGVIILNTSDPSESEMILPARTREVDWESINRIVIENDDFKEYIDLVASYYQIGRLKAKDWNK